MCYSFSLSSSRRQVPTYVSTGSCGSCAFPPSGEQWLICEGTYVRMELKNYPPPSICAVNKQPARNLVCCIRHSD